jgi:glycosidase
MGYDALQLSPLQKSIDGSQWWARYQPVSHECIEGLGSASELKELCKTCSEHGMTVVADIVFNHMAVVASRNDWLRARKNPQYEEELLKKLVLRPLFPAK